jgi:hypothetical protein
MIIMTEQRPARFFLGANSSRGFCSLYDHFVDPEAGDFLWVIKGGPGCGKSTFMKLVGAAVQDRGLDVEYIHCSGDPDSLDAIYIPQIKTAYADGTSPHVLDPLYPAAAGLYLDLGSFYDPAALEGKLNEIIELNTNYKACYTRAYSSLAAAGDLHLSTYPGLIGDAERQVALRRADSAIANEFGRAGHGTGKIKRRFLGAFSCKGDVFFEHTVDSLCSRVYCIDNDYGLADIYLNRLLRTATDRQYDVILCLDWLCTNQIQALLIPELSLGFVATHAGLEYTGKIHRHIRLDATIPLQKIKSLRPGLRSTTKLITALKGDALSSLKTAKAIHDALEAVYNPHVDFKGLREVAQSHIQWVVDQLEQGD